MGEGLLLLQNTNNIHIFLFFSVRELNSQIVISIHHIVFTVPIIQHAMQIHDTQTYSNTSIMDLTFMLLY